MEGLETTAATAATPTPAAAPVADQPAVATPASPEAGQPASPSPEPAGSQNNPVVVPRGTQEKFKEIEAGGYKPEAIEAYLATIQDEATRQLVKDSLDGKQVYLKEGEIDLESVDPFLPEDLENLEDLVKDPELTAARIKKMSEEFIALHNELEQAKNSIPEPMQRVLQHPLVKVALEEMGRGEPLSMQWFNGDVFAQEATALIDSGNTEAIKSLVSQVPEAMNQLLAVAVADTKAKMEQEFALKAEVMKLESEVTAGLTSVANLPEFKSNVPPRIGDQPNLQHPGVAFSYWLQESLADGSVTPLTIEKFGGYQKVALQWLANQRGGMGKLIADARNQGAMSFREKLLRGKRDGSLSGSTAATLNVPTGGVATALVHGVDIDLAAQNTPSGQAYAKAALRGLSPQQQSEVAQALRVKLGIA